jgi:cytochrome o ubiquinol oxidase subunit II
MPALAARRSGASPAPHALGSKLVNVGAGRWARRIATAAPWLLLGGCSGGGTHLSFLDPQGPVADIQRLHFLEVFGLLAVFVALPVFLVTPWFVWRYRYGATARYAPKWNFSAALDIACWAGPIVIVALLGALVWGSTHALDPYKPLASKQAALRVEVIGYDWKWLFIYPDEGIASIGELALPAGRPVALQLTSATVMQSLLIPALGSQIYAMGGMVTQLHLEAAHPGRFLGENTLYNGNGFSQEKFTTIAMPAAGFAAWVRKIRASGIPMDAATLAAISRRTTRAQLARAVVRSGSGDDDLYFRGVSAALFPAVVTATKNGTSVAAAAVGIAGSAATFTPAMPENHTRESLR